TDARQCAERGAGLAREIRRRLAGAGRARRGRAVSARRAVARPARLHLDDPDHSRPRRHRADAGRDACPYQAAQFPHPAAAHAAALDCPRRHRLHRGAVRFRHRVRPLQRRLPPAARRRRPAAGLDHEHQSARAARPRGGVQAPRAARFDARLRRRELVRPARAAARLCRPRSRRAGGRRRPGRPVDRRAAFPTRRRHADRRPPSAHRRQLAHALSLADAAQRGVRQPPALSAVPAEFSGLYPEGQARQLVRVLRRGDGAQLLDRHRADLRRLRRGAEALDHHAQAQRRNAHDAAAPSDLRHRRSEQPGLKDFAGTVVHSGDFKNAAQWQGRKALVLGTGTSGHDVAQELHAHGADVAIIQRSKTYVVSLKEAQRVYAIYSEGIPIDDCDLLATSMPYPVLRRSYQVSTAMSCAIDKPLLDRLAAAGFRLWNGEDDTGFQMMYLRRGGGYYFNVGCSELIIDGKVKLVQFSDIDRFVADGARLKDGGLVPAELLVLATGYKNQQDAVRLYLGETIADKIGPVWGFDEGGELRNMWRRTAQDGLWFTAGSLAQCRIFSRYLALQIKALELGLLR